VVDHRHRQQAAVAPQRRRVPVSGADHGVSRDVRNNIA
jgi:hypothetical protein